LNIGVVCFLFRHTHSNSTNCTCSLNGKQTTTIFKKLSCCEIVRLGIIYFYTICLIFVDFSSRKNILVLVLYRVPVFYKVHVLSSHTPPAVLGVTMENLATFIYALLDVEDQPSDATVLCPLIERARSGNVSFALVPVY
jgi:hypothetical protein